MHADPTVPQRQPQQPSLVVADFEGVFIPEIWIAVAEQTGIDDLRKTTRDIADYAELMAYRLAILDSHGLALRDIQQVIAGMEPLPGARDFMDWIRTRAQFVVLTDSFYQFVAPFIPKLGYPTIFAHQLATDAGGRITGYALRVSDSKRGAVQAFHANGFRVMAFGDSYNDTTMLLEADHGVLFCPPANVIEEFPQLPVTTRYDELRREIDAFLQPHTA